MRNLTILWVDDMRNPYKYFNKKSTSKYFLRNKSFYTDLMKQYKINFVWVKNLYQFIEYIEKNGVPEFISFDHDLNNRGGGEGLSDEQKLNNNGANCAMWLVKYCQKTHSKMPKFFIHSANDRGSEEINRILNNNMKHKVVHINEGQFGLINEDVYASNKKGKNKIQLSYKKRASSAPTRNFGTLNPGELLNTGKMDQDNSDTFEVPLKGGITSYNITSIRGTEIMHYFKNKFAKMDLDLDGDGKKETYELWMEQPEYNEFFNQFYKKVNNVISYATNKIYNESEGKVKFKGVSIYPVYSSSNFNDMVASQLEGRVKFNGLPVTKIDMNLFRKNLSNLKKDEEFIEKNKEYYNSKMFNNANNDITHNQYIDKELARFSKVNEIKPLIDEYNIAFHKLNTCFVTNRKRYGENFGKALSKFYINLYEKFVAIEKMLGKMHRKNIYDKLKGSKPQIEAKKTKEVWEIVKPYLRGTGIKSIPMHKLQPEDFQIKNLSNDVRMGLKNYFMADADIVEKEMNKIKGTVFVIFDDNISGGATLSDICLQAKQLGIEYIIPITFGEMQKKYSLGIGNQINKPSKSGDFENY